MRVRPCRPQLVLFPTVSGLWSSRSTVSRYSQSWLGEEDYSFVVEQPRLSSLAWSRLACIVAHLLHMAGTYHLAGASSKGSVNSPFCFSYTFIGASSSRSAVRQTDRPCSATFPQYSRDIFSEEHIQQSATQTCLANNDDRCELVRTTSCSCQYRPTEAGTFEIELL